MARKKAKPASRSGRSLTEDERMGGRMTWRSSHDVLAVLDGLADRWGVSRGEVLTRLVLSAKREDDESDLAQGAQRGRL